MGKVAIILRARVVTMESELWSILKYKKSKNRLGRPAPLKITKERKWLLIT